MDERIKTLRKHLGLNQTEFGARIGVKQGSVAGYESGARVPLDAIVSAICREYRVNELWLRTGEGPMMHEMDEDQEMEDIIASLVFANTDRAEGVRAILRAYWKLPEEAKKALDQLIEGMKQ